MFVLLLYTGCNSEFQEEQDPKIGIFLEDGDGDGFLAGEDCDDENAEIYPQATEICDGIDNNCNGLSDEDVLTTFYADTDKDGYGSATISTEACSVPEGYTTTATDCDDTSNIVYPGAEEICDEIDNDCNTEIDDGIGQEYFVDNDEDGYGSDEVTEACMLRDGLSTISGDCDDSNPNLSPEAIELCDSIDNNCNNETDEGVSVPFYLDQDEDGYGNPELVEYHCEQPLDYVANADDCNDLDTLVHPLQNEYCDGKDNNCDGVIDDSASVDASTWYADTDGDGYGNALLFQKACEQPFAHVNNSEDCDDTEDNIHPNAQEFCNETDDDCNDIIDDDSAVDALLFFADSDYDGFGNINQHYQSCSIPLGYQNNSEDCDDNNDTIHPNAPEICNEVDDNCDNEIDNNPIDLLSFYLDEDGDGFGDSDSQTSGCTLLDNSVFLDGDCDDSVYLINPSMVELCDEIDNNCDDSIDESDAIDALIFFEDLDGDGFGNPHQSLSACEQPDNYVTDNTDCNDESNLSYPNAPEIVDDGIDQDCSGVDSIDGDEDGFGDLEDCDDNDATIFPEAPELCDGIVNACGQNLPNNEVDSDNDGYVPCEIGDNGWKGDLTVNGGEDCDDNDATIFPEASELCDGIVNACGQNLPNNEVDSDNDGYVPCEIDDNGWRGVSIIDGSDCDNSDAAVNPSAIEIFDAIDNNCDGLIDTITGHDIEEGDLLFSEMMIDPSIVDDSVGEWIEIYNNSDMHILLQGLTISDNSESFQLETDDVVMADEYYVIGPNADGTINGGVSVDYDENWNLELSNNSDEIYIENSSLTIDEVLYDSNWPIEAGVSLNLDNLSFDSAANDDIENWCTSSLESINGEFGSPGTANESCNVLPSNFSLTHISNHKEISLSWTSGIRNGGSTGCFIQYNQSGIWESIPNGIVDCDTDTNTIIYLPDSNWTSENWSGTHIRLVRESDSFIIHEFSTSITCTPTLASNSETPTIDEDCDGDWDNSITNGCWTEPCRYENHTCGNTDICYYVDIEGIQHNLSHYNADIGCPTLPEGAVGSVLAVPAYRSHAQGCADPSNFTINTEGPGTWYK